MHRPWAQVVLVQWDRSGPLCVGLLQSFVFICWLFFETGTGLPRRAQTVCESELLQRGEEPGEDSAMNAVSLRCSRFHLVLCFYNLPRR